MAIIDPANQTIYAAGFLPITDRSYTDHRYLNGQELIHMKGRVYDPTFGRFLSADPHIQSPLMSQSLNRYSYVMNNPLSMTDPSGYFFSWLKKLFKKIMRTIKRIIKKIVKVIRKVIRAVARVLEYTGAFKIAGKLLDLLPPKFRQVLAVVVASVVQAVLTPLMGPQNAAFFAGFAGGFIATGSVEAALIGGLTAFAFAGVGNYFEGISAANNFANAGAVARGVAPVVKTLSNGLTRVQFGLKALAHGAVGGLSAKLSGGSFSKSFFSTAVVQAFAPRIGGIDSQIGRVGAAALLGGVGSKLVGGSFSTGARLGAFSRWFNDELHSHEYKYKTKICDRDQAACTAGNVWESTKENSIPAVVDNPDLVRQEVFDDQMKLINTTTSDHPLHNGQVTRQVLVTAQSIYVTTHGTGVNHSWGLLNSWTMSRINNMLGLYFPGFLDIHIINDIHRQNYPDAYNQGAP